jgi:hypothetical protein
VLDFFAAHRQSALQQLLRPVMARATSLPLADDIRVSTRLLSLGGLILIIIGQSLTGALLAPA